jgi:hypothetical protein
MTDPMPPTLRALLEHVLDYAGMFPPAKLPLGDAVRNYLAYRESPQSWMLGGFVCPVARLKELATVLEGSVARPVVCEGDRPRTFICYTIGSPADDLKQLAKSLADDLRQMGDYARRMSKSLAADIPELSLEFRLPPDGCVPDADRGMLLDHINRAATEYDVPLGPVFLEVPLEQSSVTAVARGVSSFLWRTNGVFGLKFRTGGADAAAYPSCQALARGMAACRTAGLVYKLTAGLHQPLRHMDPQHGARAHGFLNVLIAAALAHTRRRMPAKEIQAVLEEEAMESFALQEGQLGWRKHSVTLQQIREARQAGLVSFGSCSFDEPLEGLRAIGWSV